MSTASDPSTPAARTRHQHDEAKRYANESYRAAKRLPSSLTDDVASTRTTVGGVPLPGYFHEGVIRARLGGLLET
ncbi:hypothetical protein ABN028_24320 [Actinopolymorpha sp. B17G11]|uniref:hypothetical protein n=1 Tax=Actinopolymorpha sp. B17G11 TaxID=3160861 RepID=UPI0032E3BE24